MTLLALNLSRYVNGVTRRHGVVSAEMFPGYPIDSVTNGVHSRTWTAASFRALFDRRIPGWDGDPSLLRHALRIPKSEIAEAHRAAKAALFAEVERRASRRLDPSRLTIGFARRATPYKRVDLVFHDLDRLAGIAQRAPGGLQLVLAGKAHPGDEGGKETIRRVFLAARTLGSAVPVIYLEDYDWALAAAITAGVDLWLNMPLPPQEASGTSGMKAAHNGVPSLSVLDGWWLEGHIEGVTGWSIGSAEDVHLERGAADRRHAEELYDKLERSIIPVFYGGAAGWLDVMRHTIAINAAYFNSHRMVLQYAATAYL